MAVVKPFRALRYDEAAAGPLADLVAPPYDVITPEQRDGLRARSPYNVVHVTLPDSEDEAAQTLERWRAEGILVEEPPAVWALEQEYVGPDGVARTRFGLVASLKVEPYATGTVLPHERTHAGPKEGRLRLLRATRVQLEPIFLLYDGAAPVEQPDHEPDLEVEGARLWRIDDPTVVRAFDDKQLLIADGHHRYETAVAFSEEEGTPASAQQLVVLVSTADPGLEIFPTHRLFARPARLAGERAPEGAGVVEVRRDGEEVVRVPAGQLDVQLVDTLGHDGISYTPDEAEARRAVASGEAAVAYLLRPTKIEDVFAAARRGEVLAAGRGGDDTTAIDAAAEAAVVRRLETLGESFTLVSEELGERAFNGGGPTHVVCDPIDGSLNAKRDIPFFSLSLAVARGGTMGDVEFGYVYDFGSGEEWTAERGAGAQLNGAPLGAVRPKDEIEILSFEATTTAQVADKAAQVAGTAYRLRIMGSLALSLCHLAAGRVDAVCSLKPARSVDIAAGQLLVRECGLAIDLFEDPPFDAAPLDLAGRSRVVAAGTPELCAVVAAALA